MIEKKVGFENSVVTEKCFCAWIDLTVTKIAAKDRYAMIKAQK